MLFTLESTLDNNRAEYHFNFILSVVCSCVCKRHNWRISKRSPDHIQVHDHKRHEHMPKDAHRSSRGHFHKCTEDHDHRSTQDHGRSNRRRHLRQPRAQPQRWGWPRPRPPSGWAGCQKSKSLKGLNPKEGCKVNIFEVHGSKEMLKPCGSSRFCAGWSSTGRTCHSWACT